MSLLKLAQKARQINIQQLALNVVKKNSGLIDKRIQEQLTVGENGDGLKVGYYKSPYYASLKSRIGSLAPNGVVDLKLSGNLHNGIKTDIKGSTYNTDSSVSYSKVQKERYGNKIYELQKENSEDIKFKNSIDIIKEYTKKLGL